MIETNFIALFISIGSLGMSLRIIASFKNDEARLVPQLAKLNMLLENLGERAADYRIKIEELLQETEPLQEQETKIRGYCEELTQLDLEEKREEAKRKADREGDSIKTHAVG